MADVAAVTALIVAVTGLIGAIGALIALFRKQEKTAGQITGQIQQVHELVNNQLDRQLIYSQQLTGALIAANVPVPEQERPADSSGEAGKQ